MQEDDIAQQPRKKKNRAAKGMRRAKIIHILARLDRRARKLVNTGVKPQSTYGAAAQGVPPTRRRHLRRAAAHAVAPGGFQPCPASVLHLLLGASYDPEVYLPAQQVRTWLAMWPTLDQQQKQMITETWRTTRDSLQALPVRQRWQRVTGPIWGHNPRSHRGGLDTKSANTLDSKGRTRNRSIHRGSMGTSSHRSSL